MKLREKYGDSKEAIVDQTIRLERRPLDTYREKVGEISSPPLVNEDIAATLDDQQIDFMEVYGRIKAVLPGPDGATLYHRAVADLLTAVFYPSLVNFQVENAIHDGRKRIDITCDNEASVGFFNWVNRAFHCPVIPMECKNYSRDPANPELDQLAGRFSDQRGNLGFLVCRTIDDKALFLERCRDTSRDRRGYIIALDDEDLKTLAEDAATLQYESQRAKRFAFPLLRARFDMLIN